MPAFDEVIAANGFLIDRDIRLAIDAGYLIERGTADNAQLRHASYTLRLGERVELSRAETAAHLEVKSFEVIRLEAGTSFELRPGDTALLYSMENLRLLANVLAFTVARGLLFAESLSPENTYVDPGFTGTIYTTVTNVSNRVVRLTYGMSIARLFFYRLPQAAEQPYRSGAAMKISQQLQTIPVSSVAPNDCMSATRETLLNAVTKIPIGGAPLFELFGREARYLIGLFAWSTVWPVCLVLANTNDWLRAHVGGFLSNVLASVVAGIVLVIAPWAYRRISKQW